MAHNKGNTRRVTVLLGRIGSQSVEYLHIIVHSIDWALLQDVFASLVPNLIHSLIPKDACCATKDALRPSVAIRTPREGQN
jgi:hypothetical protein